MREYFLLGLVVTALHVLSDQGVNTKSCDDSNRVLARVCYELFKTMENRSMMMVETYTD